MLRSNPEKHTPLAGHQLPTTLQGMLLAVSLILFLIALPVIVPYVQAATEPVVLSFAQPETAAAAAQLSDSNPQVREQAIQKLAKIGAVEATDQLIAFFARDDYLVDNGLATAKALAATGSKEALQTLIKALRQNESPTRRMAALTALEEAKPSVTPMLIAALNHSDAGVRRGAVDLLGYRRVSEATSNLLAATRDSDPRVREAAVWALNEVAGTQALPRYEQMQLTDLDPQVRDAASQAEENQYLRAASLLGVDRADVRAIAVAASSGQAYAVTLRGLYRSQNGRWELVSDRLPDAATALAVSNDGQALYLGTTALGLFRSTDGGRSWQTLRIAVPDVQRIAVSAVTVHPVDARQVFVALTTILGTSESHEAPLAIFRSMDAGETWSALSKAPTDQIATRLVIDQTMPEFLYGVSDQGAWRTRIQ